jgi:RND family efflux transporter MFP subunit
VNKSIRYSLLSVALLPIIAGCGKKSEPAGKPTGEKSAIPVTLVPVARMNVDRSVEVVGTLFGDEEITVSAKVAGRVVSINADIGDRIAGGAVLAQIDPTDYQLEVSRRENALTEALSVLGLTQIPEGDFDVNTVSTVERARFQAANAKAKLDRARRLFDQKPPLISDQEFADLETAYEVAQRDHDVARLEARSHLAAANSRLSELNVAREQLANTKIVAPTLAGDRKFAVASRSVSQGEYVREATATFRLVLDDTIKFRGALPERFAQQVAVDQPVSLTIAGETEPVVGKVSRISPAINVETRTFQVEAVFDNENARLRPGAFARGSIIVGQSQNVQAVPQSAIVSFAGVDKIFSVRDGKAVEHQINPGVRVGDLVPLRQPIKGVESVIASGNTRVFSGAAVAITPTTQPTTAPIE